MYDFIENYNLLYFYIERNISVLAVCVCVKYSMFQKTKEKMRERKKTNMNTMFEVKKGSVGRKRMWRKKTPKPNQIRTKQSTNV